MENFSDFVTTISEVNECVVCLDEMDEVSNAEPIVRLACEHELHTKCLRTLIQNARDDIVLCPVCRKFVAHRVIADEPRPRQQETITNYTRGMSLLFIYCLIVTGSFVYVQFVYDNVRSEQTDYP